MYFLYKLIDPITKEIKYIGYTKRPKKGINFTEEHKEKLSRAKKGKKRSKESIENQIKTKSEPIHTRGISANVLTSLQALIFKVAFTSSGNTIRFSRAARANAYCTIGLLSAYKF